MNDTQQTHGGGSWTAYSSRFSRRPRSSESAARAHRERPSIEGVWQTSAVTITGPGARTIDQVPPNLAIITAKHYSRVEIHADGTRPSLPDASKASAESSGRPGVRWSREAGSYDTSGGNVLTHTPCRREESGGDANRASSRRTLPARRRHAVADDEAAPSAERYRIRPRSSSPAWSDRPIEPSGSLVCLQRP